MMFVCTFGVFEGRKSTVLCDAGVDAGGEVRLRSAVGMGVCVCLTVCAFVYAWVCVHVCLCVCRVCVK